MSRSKSNRRKPKKGAWFVPLRGSYIPATSAGWLSYIPYVAYLVVACEIGFSQTDSNSLAVLFIVPNWVAATAVMTWVASRKS